MKTTPQTTHRATAFRCLAGIALGLWVLGCDQVSPTPTPSPTLTPTPSPTLTPTPSPTLTPTRPPVALNLLAITGIGDVAQGADSGNVLVLQFAEPTPVAIGTGPGSIQLTLTDTAGSAASLSFTGTPSIAAPGSLGASATFSAPNVLTISILDSDTLNVEPMTVSGVGIRASSSAAVGPIIASVAACTGSLAGCTASSALPSPGNVVAAH